MHVVKPGSLVLLSHDSFLSLYLLYRSTEEMEDKGTIKDNLILTIVVKLRAVKQSRWLCTYFFFIICVLILHCCYFSLAVR